MELCPESFYREHVLAIDCVSVAVGSNRRCQGKLRVGFGKWGELLLLVVKETFSPRGEAAGSRVESGGFSYDVLWVHHSGITTAPRSLG